MSIHTTLFFSLFIFLYGIVNYYIGIRGWQALSSLIPFLNPKPYWFLFWFFALSYIIGRTTVKYIPSIVSSILTIIGSYWMVILLYSFFIIIAVDLIRLMNKFFHFIPASIYLNKLTLPIITGVSLILLSSLIVYGAYNAKNIKITKYDLQIPKSAGNISELKIAMVSDIHLGRIVGVKHLERMVNIINHLNPDIIIFAGDIIDENIEVVMEKNMSDILKKLNPRFGSYGVLGNHEYFGGHCDKIVEYLTKANINVLMDNYTLLNNNIYIVGREDRAAKRINGKSPRELSDILEGINKTMPVILISHEPIDIENANAQGVDLMLSGHTHRGQIFPNHFITKRVFEIDWGHLKKDDFNIIVSSGYGTWGPPLRIDSNPEIVDIKLHFKNK